MEKMLTVCGMQRLFLLLLSAVLLINHWVISMPAPVTIQEQIQFLEPFCQRLLGAKNFEEKIQLLDVSPFTAEFLGQTPLLSKALESCTPEEAAALKAVLAIGQGPHVFYHLDRCPNSAASLKKLAAQLAEVERFYAPVGGIAGYHLLLLKLIQTKDETSSLNDLSFSKPDGLNIPHADQKTLDAAVRWGIENMEQVAEIYPVGGAGDRLNLKDPASGTALPAARLPFCGRSLLEGLIRDLQGREYLYYKLFGRQITVPVAMMTSHEKQNDAHIKEIFQQTSWFGRAPATCTFFIQPLVPVLTIEGNWAMQAPCVPYFKPGGHGVIWKAARDLGVFDWLEKRGAQKALVRQINNPVAGIDHGLLILSGIGCHENKQFGFASCYRRVNAAEGVNILFEEIKREKHPPVYKYCIGNLEYTDFKKFGIEDVPMDASSPYSRFPANTNILFTDLEAVNQAVERCPFPGLLINMKTKMVCDAPQGPRELPCGRLETLMQNISESLSETFPYRLNAEQQQQLGTFVTYNERQKTLSCAKKAYEKGKPLLETPEGCFYELMLNYRQLLARACQIELPPQQTEQEYMQQGPAFIALFHPALGGIFSVIAQKIQGGRLAAGSEWIMEIAEADVQQLDLDGSLLIYSDEVMGAKDAQGQLKYSSSTCSRCTLHNVKVKNRGTGGLSFQEAWKQQYTRQEALTIVLHGNAEFAAHDVQFEGDLNIEVPAGFRLTATQNGSEILWIKEAIQQPSWQWRYTFDAQDRICLEKE